MQLSVIILLDKYTYKDQTEFKLKKNSLKGCFCLEQ